MDDRMDVGSDDLQPANEYQNILVPDSSLDLVAPYDHFYTLPSAFQAASFIQPASHARSIFSSDYSRGTPASSVFDVDFVSQIYQEIQQKIDSLELDELYRLRNVLQKALSQVDTLISAMPPDEEAQHANIEHRYRCLLCPSQTTVKSTYTNKGTFKRHISTQHYPEKLYRCPLEGCSNVFLRLDKLHLHMKQLHKQPPVGRKDREAISITNPPPKNCPVCHRSQSSWVDFLDCVMRHCLLAQTKEDSDGSSNAGDQDPSGFFGGPSINQEPQSGYQDLSNAVPPAPFEHKYGKAPQEPHSSPSLQARDPEKNAASGADNISSRFPRYEASSATTAITTPEPGEELSIDTGISSTGDLEAILNPASNIEALCGLESDTQRLCGLNHMNPRTITPGATFSVDLSCSIITGCRDAFHNLHDKGFCGREIPILREDPTQPGIAESTYITFKEIDSLALCVADYRHSGLNDLSIELMQNLMTRFLGHGTTVDCSSLKVPSVFSFLCKVLSIGIVSFSGSHVCPFDHTFWDQEVLGIDVGHGFRFCRRNLACLGTFIGGPVWVLSSENVGFEDTRLMLSLTVQDLQLLWGPVWMIGGSEDVAPAIRTERGYIVPVSEKKSIASQVDGIPCHWTEELPDHLLQENILADCVQISKTSRLVIGLDEQEQKLGITVNARCRTDANFVQKQHAFDLRLPGTSKAHYVGEGYEVSLGGGYNFNIGLVKKWKRMPARTHKSMLISYCTSPHAKLLPVLKMRVGLEVSGCTGNSRRISLWDAIQLLRIGQAATHSGCTQAFCDHSIGSIECIRMCWDRQSEGPLDDLNKKPESSAYKEGVARREVINSILALQHTGIDHEGCLQAFWPFSDCPQVCRIKVNTGVRKNNWLRMVEDTPVVSTFAVLSQRCLGMQSSPANVCLSACYQTATQPLPTALGTRVLIGDLKGQITTEITVGNRVRIGDTSLETVGMVAGEPQLLFATVKRAHLPSVLDHSIRAREYINQDNLVDHSFMMISY
ncbi:hypothetical protein BDW69DRAFT_45657 [Aspergillus filifer]